tara:strand:- start:110 stop:1036 length:927 start_codon:yes stop_codon:yes gene_type:complete
MRFQSALRQFLSHFDMNWAHFACVPAFSVFLTFFLLVPGCAPAATSGGGSGTRTQTSSLYEPGDDALLAPEERASQVSKEPAVSEGAWSIALLTITGNDHQATAKALRSQIAAKHPELTPLFLDEVGGGQGSAIFVGRFQSPKDPRCRALMEEIRQMTSAEGNRLFPRAMPGRPQSVVAASLHPHDLRTVRLGRRSSTPMYTLQIAQWGTFGDDSIAYDRCRAQAESMARSLRARGLTAWFSHNDGRSLSSVNIGVFGPDAYDPRSTLFSPEVEVLMQRFPQLQVNGEVLLDPRTGIARTPFLVEVPR